MSENKGTVLYVGGFELPDKNPAAHRVLNNAKILKNLGYNVVFCGVDKEIENLPTKPDMVCGFESYPIPYPSTTKKWVKRMFDITPYTSLLSRYDNIKYIFCYNLHAVPLAKLLKIANKTNIKLIADCTEWYEHKFSFNAIKLIKCVDTLLCMRYFQKKCDGMIAISSFLANYYKRYIKNTIVLPPLVDLEDEKYKLNKPKNTVTTLVYSGNPSASKEALGDVVKSLNSFSDLDFKLLVVGIDKERFQKIYKVIPVSQKIQFLGKVSHKEALDAVKKSDYSLIIRPKSRVTTAGFPTKFAEAISCGTAVIANDISDVSNYLKNGKNGFLVSLETLEQDLHDILSSSEIPKVEYKTFDYRNWTELIAVFLEKVSM